MASEVKEETNSTPSETKNDVDEKVKDEDSKLKDSVKDESKEETGKSTSTDESKSKKEEEEDEEDEDGEEEVGLLDRPVEVTGCRARKKVERLIVSFSTPKEKEDFKEGKGKKLGDCPKIEFQISKSKVQDLKPLHRILFSRIGSANEIKKNIRKFSGFPFEQDSVEFNRKKASLEKVTMAVLKQICSTLDIERGGTKGEITNRIMNFLLKPEDSGKKVPSAKKKAPKDDKKNAKKGKSEKKSKADKNENSAEESEKSEDEDDDSSGGDASMGGTDEENEIENESGNDDEEEEEEEEPKKKSKDTKSAKGKSKADKVKKEEKKSKGSKRKADEDSNASSTDEPVAKKSKMPTDDEISKLVKQILESADLQEITMKKVIKQVSDAYPDFDLSHKKAFIKQTIKSVIS